MSNDTLKLHSDWQVKGDHHLERTFTFADWKGAIAFVNKVSVVAEEMNHHPDVELGWGRVVLKMRTHDKQLVGPKDYALAARVDVL